ncbi:hypothetical protein CC80DRAFT_292518 [Byssothecium circinans]|uniref:Uncharacterized protein n=1 Tax=Byssothecium circinans TaxID=147558 RepID=A0A6A5U8P7_9PLEO|nr:hypothetical protein CC80DRAFT_292518 [Byssothecium circinans]
MPTERPIRAIRSGRGVMVLPKGPASALAPASRAKSVPASVVFKRPAALKKSHKKVEFTPTLVTNVSYLPIVPSSPHSSGPSKHGSAHNRRDVAHPLETWFAGRMSEYREHLYMKTTAKLNESYNTLINDLHNVNLVAMSSPPITPSAKTSPPKITISAKFDHARQKLFNPIGEYTITTSTINASGQLVKTPVPLQQKLSAFTDSYKQKYKELQAMHKRWEIIMGELWKTGVTCLGEETMASLFIVTPEAEALPPTKEDSLFIPEHSPDLNGNETGKKRVAFQESTPELPSLLLRPSVLEPVTQAPVLSEEMVREIQSEVINLGNEQVDELMRVAEDQKKLWKKKIGNVMRALKDD